MSGSITLKDIETLISNGQLSETDMRVLEAQLTKLESLKDKELSQQKFIKFVEKVWPVFISGAHHKRMAEAFERVANGTCKRLIINMPPRHAILVSMDIPTTAGFKSIAALNVGDFVFGPDGVPTEVLGKSEVFAGRQLYRVTTDDGAYIDVDGEHLWTVRLDRKHGIYNDYTTEQLWRRQNGEVLRTKRGGGVEFLNRVTSIPPRLPMLPDVAPAQYPHTPLPVDPYVLGVWLGDGSSASGVVTAKDDDAVFVRAEFERRGVMTTDQATRYTFGTLGLQAALRSLGVLGNKHIPKQYLTASIVQRRDLLKGLMDTDGNVSKKGQCFFAQSDRMFIEQVAELVRSLGIKASVLESEAKIGAKSYGLTWKLSFYANDVFNLPRKEERTLKGERTFGRYIRVEKLDISGDTQCIKVDREDGLFLAGEGYICTHNTKSEFASYLLPAWFLGKFPHKKVIQASHTAELAVGFGRKVRNLVDSEIYREIFPELHLQADSKAAGRWNTSKGGDYFAIGVGGAVTGKGADVLIIDDPHSEQEAAIAASNPDVYDKVYEWYTSGPRQRLQPGGAIVVVMTRWSQRDLTGQVLKAAAARNGEEWEVIEFPAILPSGNPLWPQFWSIEELAALQRELPNSKWQAQYQQNPVGNESAIIKRDWWKLWTKPLPPQCDYILQTWDTAFEKNNRADYSAGTTWGVFNHDEDNGMPNIILLNTYKKRVEYPDLKRDVLKEYAQFEPDGVLIEKKASGAPLIYDLRAMGIPVQEYTPGKGQDKIARLNAVSDIIASGKVWVPETRWAEELIDEIAEFPSGAHDDLVDATTLALMRFRQGGFLRLPSDEPEEVKWFKGHQRDKYYTI